MNDLVVSNNGVPTVSSREVAKRFGKVHKNVLRDIVDLDVPDEFSRLNFEPRDFVSSRGATYQEYVMTRDGFSLLCMGFTGKKAMEWKLKFLEAFNTMERMILKAGSNKDDPVWVKAREQGKIARREETDVIKEFVEYATKQGSQSAKFYYKHITMACYSCLQLIESKKPKLRDTLDLMELNQLVMAEVVAKRSLIRHMTEGEHYKVIFTLVKQDLDRYAESIMLPKLENKNA